MSSNRNRVARVFAHVAVALVRANLAPLTGRRRRGLEGTLRLAPQRTKRHRRFTRWSAETGGNAGATRWSRNFPPRRQLLRHSPRAAVSPARGGIGSMVWRPARADLVGDQCICQGMSARLHSPRLRVVARGHHEVRSDRCRTANNETAARSAARRHGQDSTSACRSASAWWRHELQNTDGDANHGRQVTLADCPAAHMQRCCGGGCGSPQPDSVVRRVRPSL